MNASVSEMRRRASVSRSSIHNWSVGAASAPSTCRICLSSIRLPAALTCGHMFCEKCLQQYWSEGEKPLILVCPLCRANNCNIRFAKIEATESTEEFRKMFTPTECADAVEVRSNILIVYLQIIMFMSAVYNLLWWLAGYAKVF